MSTETVRSWLSGRRRVEEDDEFAYLNTPVKLGEWLRARIAASGCTVRQIAETTDAVSMGTIYYWLRGRHLPKPPAGDEPDRFDLLLSNPRLNLGLRQRIQLDEVRRRLTGTSLRAVAEPGPEWPARGLPADSRSFTGRGKELHQLDGLLRAHARGQEALIAAVTGTGGVGKTALAVRWARTRQVRATFTDGCLYLNLNGYADTPPTSPDAALTKLLLQLGVEPRDLPKDPDVKTALYRQSLAGRKLLVMLDNAYAEPQVRPLLPTDANCLAIITSRNRLHGLEASDTGISRLPLDTLTVAEAASLLRNLLGREATGTASNEEIDALAAACGRLPLAIHIVVANYLTHHRSRSTSIGGYAATLAEDRLGHLVVGRTDPATAFAATMDRSYRHLTDAAQHMYRLLSLHSGPDYSAEAAASLVGLDLTGARAVLTELTQANLLTETTAGRYAFHDLVRDHAAALADRLDSGTENGRAAQRRMIEHFLHSAYTCARVLEPHRCPLRLPEASTAVTVTEPREVADALAWFDAEATALITLIQQCHEHGWDSWCWQLAWTLTGYFDRRAQWRTWARVQQLALESAERVQRPDWRAQSHRMLGRASAALEQYDRARTHLVRALTMFEALNGLKGQATTLKNLGYVEYRQGHHRRATERNAQALERYRSLGDKTGEADGLNNLGWCLAHLGQYDQAAHHCLQALRMYQAIDDAQGSANAWDTLGFINFTRGYHASADYCYHRALGFYERSDDHRYPTARNLTHLADNYRAAGKLELAQRHYARALVLLEQLEHRDASEVQTKLAQLV